MRYALVIALLISSVAQAQDAGVPLAMYHVELLPMGAELTQPMACMPETEAQSFDAALRTDESEMAQLRMAVFASTTIGAAITIIATALGIAYALKK